MRRATSTTRRRRSRRGRWVASCCQGSIGTRGIGSMRIVVFGDAQRVGALQDGYVLDLNRASEDVPARLDAFIAGGSATLDVARREIERSLDRKSTRLNS